MSRRELDAAGITDPALRASYEACRRLNAGHGQTYYLATLLLPPAKRPAVHALYGFARYADEIVDHQDPTLTGQGRADRLAALARHFRTGTLDGSFGGDSDGGLAGDSRAGLGDGDARVLPAVWDTARRYDIPATLFEAFLASMRMDLTVSGYPSYDDLMGYVYGSAAVIGLQMVPVLGHPGVPREIVEPYATDLGVAFQLSNFLRDVGEDLARGRVYLPAEDLDAFGVTRERLERRVVDGPIRRLLAFEIARTRELYRSARAGIRLLDPTSRDCIGTALRLYARILDEIEAADYRVLDRRVQVRLGHRLAVAAPGLLRARASRVHGTAGRARQRS